MQYLTTTLQKLEAEAEDLQSRADAAAEQQRASLLGIQQLQDTMSEMAEEGGGEFLKRLMDGHSKKMIELTAAESALRTASDDVAGKVLGTQSRLAALTEHLQELSRGGDGAVILPHPQPNHVDGITPGLPAGITLHDRKCAACSEGFPYVDILLCVCGHVYHPWCASQWFKATSLCAHSHCGEVHPMWLKSWGFQASIEYCKPPQQSSPNAGQCNSGGRGPITTQNVTANVIGTSLL